MSLGPCDNKASELQQTSTAWKMDWCGKIFGLFQSNSLPIHRYPDKEPHRPSDGKLRNSHRSKKFTLTHLLLIALSHPSESKHTLHKLHTHSHNSCSSRCTAALKVFRRHTYTLPPPTLSLVVSPDCGGDCLTRCHEFTCLTSDWVLGVARLCSDCKFVLRATHEC